MDTAGEQRTFSRGKHAQGHWETKVPPLASNPAVRAIINFLSFKREGVDRLARLCSGTSACKGVWVADIGAGVGAYARWFTGRNKAAKIVAIDWSPEALRSIARAGDRRILAVCADAHMLPVKSGTIDALYSIDTLGHVEDQGKVLDEMSRVLSPGSPLFLHSECANYRNRWPDRMLIRKLGYDHPAQLDGHISVVDAGEVRMRCLRRFRINAFYSPAGLTGWLTGYPEKYREAFGKAKCRVLFLLTTIMAVVKKTPLAGAIIRFVNIAGNRLELFLGIEGGGSCFADLKKPGPDD